MSTSIGKALAAAEARLAASGVDASRLEASLLLARVLQKPRSHLIAWPDRSLAGEQVQAFRRLVERRCGGEPIAYITGERAFWTFELAVTPQTLIPRPETEVLVERALARIPRDQPLRLVDLGTGSGAVAAALALERPRCQVVATDACASALAVARANLDRLGLARVETRQGDWCTALSAEERFHLMVSNPPYVAEGDPHLARGDASREPRTALASGPEGLDALRRVAACAGPHLFTGGWLMVEHGLDQGPSVREILAQRGLAELRTYPDLSGLDRVSEGRRSPGARLDNSQ